MTIHVVSPGETVDTIAAGYGVAPRQLAADNELPPDYALAEGQTLAGRFPRAVHVVAAGGRPGGIGGPLPFLYHIRGRRRRG